MTRIMGIVNVTPDSFSDGGAWLDPQAAIDRGLTLAEQGADIIDVGGESTRPGAARVTAATELERVLPVIRGLAGYGLMVSVDTMRAEVAREAIQAGAAIVNDVSGGKADPQMASLVARTQVTYIAMHWRGHSEQMGQLAVYDDLVAQVCAELTDRVTALVSDGVAAEQIIVDPGFGFAKHSAHNWTLLAHLEQVMALGHRVLVGTSRKRFLANCVSGASGSAGATQRDAATAATSLLAAQAGAWAVRVHDVPSTADALAVWKQVRDAR